MTVRDYVRDESTRVLQTPNAMAYQKEIEKLEQRYAENPKQWFAALADAYRKQGETDLAIEYVKGGLELRPDYASAHIVLGRCYLDKDLDDDASRAFEQVLALDVENIIALKSLEEIAERQGDMAGARRWLNRLLEVDPMNEDALACLDRLGPDTGVVAEPPQAEAVSELAEMAAELGAEAPVEPAPEPLGLEPTVAEAAVDPASFDVLPIELESALPMDTPEEEEPELPADEVEPAIEPIELESAIFGAAVTAGDVSAEPIAGELEPFEIETEDDSAVDSLLIGSEAGAFPSADIGPIDIETEDAGAVSLLASMPDDYFEDDDAEEITAEIEPIELEAPVSATESLLTESLDVPEPEPVLETTLSEFEAIRLEPDVDAEVVTVEEEVTEAAEAELELVEELAEGLEEEAAPGAEIPDTQVEEEISAQRTSVPPTKEVAAIDLEALRAADEMVAQPTADADVTGEDWAEEEAILEAELPAAQPDEEIPRTREIDAVELERLRALDAFVAGSTQEAELIEEEDEVEELQEEIVDLERVEMLEADVEEAAAEEAVLVDEEHAETMAEVPLPLIMPEEVGEGESTADAEPEPVVTETMAEVYAQQGMFEQAREIYEVLVMQHADDPRLRARLDELETRATSARQELRQSRFSVAATGGESAVTYLQRIFSHQIVSETVPVAAAADAPPASEFDPTPTPLEQAFSEDPPNAPGEPTKPAADEVSLASVFDGSTPESGLNAVSPEGPDDLGVSYDEFYGADAPRPSRRADSDAGENAASDEDASSDSDASSDEDDFKNWLEGLKT